jgi:putative endonuclease
VARAGHDLGLRAELATADWLRRSGWLVLAHRWRSPGGELDLVCRDPAGLLVGVEVKLRRTTRAGAAIESIDRRRLQRLRTSLAAYARQLPDGARRVVGEALRLDLVTVTPTSQPPSASRAWRLQRIPGIDAW